MLLTELTSYPSRSMEDNTAESCECSGGPSHVVSYGNNISNWLENIFLCVTFVQRM